MPSMSQWSRYIGGFITLLIVGAIVYYFSQIITWVVVAWIVSLLGSPIMKLLGRIRLGKWRLPAAVRAVVVLFLFYGLFYLFIMTFVPLLIEQGRNLAGVNYAELIESLDEPISRANDWLIEKGLTDGELSEYALQDSLEAKAEKPQSDSLRLTADSTARDSLVQQPSALIDSTQEGSAALLPPNDSQRGPPVAAVLPSEVNGIPLRTRTVVRVDSLLLANGDTITQTNVAVNLQVMVEQSPEPKKQIKDTTAIIKNTDGPLEKLQKQVYSFFNPTQLTMVVSSTISFLGSLLLFITSVSFIAFFFLKDEELFGNFLKSVVADRYMDEVEHALSEIKRMLTRYFGGILLQVTTITTFVSVGLILLGVPNAFLIGFFAGVINVIPYVGPLIGGVFGILITISTNLDADFYAETLPLLIEVFVVFAAMQMLDNFVLQPVIFSNSVSAHPLEIFIVIIIGSQLGGIVGMLVATPAYTVIRVIASVFLSEFKIVQSMTQQMNVDLDDEEGPPSDTA